MSKWANLPDIDLEGSEVYETSETTNTYHHEDDSDSDNGYPFASTSQHQHESGSSNADILTDRLNTVAARNKFKGSRLEHGDFSTSFNKKSARHYPPSTLPDSTIYEILPRGFSTGKRRGDLEEYETPEARLRRLRYELDELEADIEAQTDASRTGDEEEEDDAKRGIPAATALLAQLRMMRNEAARLDAHPSVPAQDPTSTSSKTATEPAPASATTMQAQKGSPIVAELSSQLGVLERLVGPSELSLLDTSSTTSTHILSSATPLVHALATLESQLTLLTQPRHLDTLGRRIKTMVTELERIHETRRKLGDTMPLNVALSSGLTVSIPGDGSAGPATQMPATPSQGVKSEQQQQQQQLPADVLPRLEALFQLLPRLQSLAPLTPSLLLRLRSLASLHSSAAEFESRLSETSTLSETLVHETRELSNVVKEVQHGLEQNEEIMKGNLKAVQERVELLGKRIDQLKV